MFICSQDKNLIINLNVLKNKQGIWYKDLKSDDWVLFCEDKAVARYSSKKQCEYVITEIIILGGVEIATGDNKEVYELPSKDAERLQRLKDESE